MGRLHTLAAGTALLVLGVKAQFSYQGCVSLDTSTIKNTTELYPQGPVPCLSFCNGLGYSYAAITAQFCSCWGYSSPPVVNKLYPDSGHADCSFNCDDPYSNQYCGGIDLTTLGFLYSYYAGVAPAVVGNNSSSSTTAPVDIATTSSTDVIATPPATSSGEDVSSTSTSSIDTGSVNPTEGSSTTGPTSPQSSSPSDSGIPSQSSSPSDSGIPSQSTSAGETSPPSTSEVSPSTSSGQSSALPPTSSGMSEGPGSSSTSGAAGSSEGSPSQTSFPPGVIVPTSSSSGSASPSSTAAGGAPIATLVVLIPGQAFVISIAPFLRSPGDQALSYIPSPAFLLYNANITSFFGTVPLTFPPGPLVITVTAGQPTTGSNGLGRRQVPAGTYTFAIELIIVAPGVSVPTLPSTPVPTPTLSPVPGAPGAPGAPGPVLPSYTNTVYQTVTSTITRCPVCAPEVTVYAVPIGTTCVTAQVFTTPCPVTVTTTLPNGVVTPVVTTTISNIPYNPAESTVIVKTVVEKTAKYTTTLLVAVTQTVAKVQPTGNAGAVQQPAAPPAAAPPAAAPPAAAPPAAAPPAAAPPAAAPVPGAAAPPNGAPFSGPVAPPPNGAFGTGAANNGSQNAAPTMPVTAGASMDRFVEMFVLLCGVAFGALLLL